MLIWKQRWGGKKEARGEWNMECFYSSVRSALEKDSGQRQCFPRNDCNAWRETDRSKFTTFSLQVWRIFGGVTDGRTTGLSELGLFTPSMSPSLQLWLTGGRKSVLKRRFKYLGTKTNPEHLKSPTWCCSVGAPPTPMGLPQQPTRVLLQFEPGAQWVRIQYFYILILNFIDRSPYLINI